MKESEKRSASVLICIFGGPIQTFCCKFCEKTEEVGGATGRAETVLQRSKCGKPEWHRKMTTLAHKEKKNGQERLAYAREGLQRGEEFIRTISVFLRILFLYILLK